MKEDFGHLPFTKNRQSVACGVVLGNDDLLRSLAICLCGSGTGKSIEQPNQTAFQILLLPRDSSRRSENAAR
jgi:hypothetical protein